MSQIPSRSVRLNARPATYYQSFVGTAGEIFYDSTNQTLRVYPGNTVGGKILADRDWVNSAGVINYNNLINKPVLFSGSYNDLTNKPFLFSGSYDDLTNKPSLAATYQFSIAADDSTQRVISTDEVVKFIGAGSITTASDAEGNITITGSNSLTNTAYGVPVSVSLDASANLLLPFDGYAAFFASKTIFGNNTGGAVLSSGQQKANVVTRTDGAIQLVTNGDGFAFAGLSWIFDTDGHLTIPGNIKSNSNINIEVNLTDSTKYIWQFGEDGALTFPDGTNQSTAFTGIPGPYADDEAAALAGVALGSPYHKTGTNGQVFVRLTSPT